MPPISTTFVLVAMMVEGTSLYVPGRGTLLKMTDQAWAFFGDSLALFQLSVS